MTAHISKQDAMTANEFHYGECRAVIGVRGGVTLRRESWRRNGQTQTWVTRPDEYRIPVKYGMRGYSSITHTDTEFHTASRCVWLIVGPIDKAPKWLLDEQTAQVESLSR